MALCVILLAGFASLPRLITTLRLLTVVRRVAAGDVGADPAVLEDTIRRGMGASELEALVYRPANASPAGAVVIIAGVSDLGCRHPRLVSLSRALAGAGFLVLTPDIRMLREFKIHPPPVDEISFWLNEVRRLDGARKLRRVGLAGISFSGTLSLIAAAQPQNKGLADYVLAIGPFDDLNRCSNFWFGAGPVTVGPGYYPTRSYAKWIVMLAALDIIQAADERRFLREVLEDLLLQKALPPPVASMSAQGERWYRLALMREDQSDPELSRQIVSRADSLLYPALSTKEPAAAIRSTVFLAHGAYDDLIPPEESRSLKRKITNARSYLLISPFLTHTHPWQKPMNWWTKASAVIELFAFFYRLAGVM